MDPAARTSVQTLMLEMLEWIARHPRTHAEAVAAWRSSCPRHPVWDDAVNAGLVRVERAAPGQPPRVVLTKSGRAMLGSAD